VKKIFTLVLAVFTVFSSLLLTSCKEKKKIDGAYDFIIYAPDSDNTNISDNPVVATYHIEYTNCATVTDTLIKMGNVYKFSSDSNDYLILKKGAYGLYYTEGYFANYSECSEGDQIDVSWSSTFVNGATAQTAIGETPLTGLNTFGFVINGWAS